MFQPWFHAARRPLAQKNLFAAAAALLLASSAHAQTSVSVYGVIDAGLLYQSANGGPGKGGKTTNGNWVFDGAGNDSANYLGFQGIEDLGGGMHAGFVLQGAFDVGTGAQASTGALWSQKSNVFLEDGNSRVTLGKQIDPGYVAMARVDPRNYSQFLSSATWWYFLEGKQTLPAHVVWEQNSISYGYKTQNLFASVLYRVGESPGGMSQNRAISSGIAYDDGTFIGAATYVVQNDSTGTRDLRIWGTGAGYRIGKLTFRGTYTDYSLPEGNGDVVVGATPKSHVIVFGTGVNWQFTSAQLLTAAYYFSENKLDPSNATSTYVLSDDYFLSKTTKLYAYFGLMHAKDGANALTNIISAATTTGYPGMNTRAIGLGLLHRF
jgi:predicted porin